jgi:hypothetical protein
VPCGHEIWHLECEKLVTIILLVVLYGCETWSLTLREEHRLKVFENRMQREYSYQRGMK